MDKRCETVLAHVSGRVQGVGFRAWTHRQALDLGLRGWVRNEPDGSVTALLSGKPDHVSLMLDRLRHGPSAAAVTAVTTKTGAQDIAPTGFQIRH